MLWKSKPWKWTKRIALGVLTLAGVSILAGLLFWKTAGPQFLYRLILPEATQLLQGQELPAELDADALRADLAYFGQEFPRLHVGSQRAFDAQKMKARIAELEAMAEELSPNQRALEIFGLFAMGETGTGHTMAFPYQPALDGRIYPFSTWWFDDGLFITAAESRLTDTVGARVSSIGGTPTDVALERLKRYVSSDNDSGIRASMPRLLGMVEPLVALGLAEPDGRLRLGLDGDGPREVLVEPATLTSWRGMRWSSKTQFPTEDAWSPADLRRRRYPFSLDYRAESKTLVLDLNRVDNRSDESLREFAARLDETARNSPVERLIIDLRANEGGNNDLTVPLVDMLSGHPVLDRHGALYVLIGPRTFSAAANFACALERRTRAIFVGETSGFAPNHYGDATWHVLPGSKMVVRIASRLWQEDLPGVERASLEPDLAVPFLSQDHFSGADPVLEAAISHQASAPPREGLRLPSEALGSYRLSPHHRVTLLVDGEQDRLAIDARGRYALTDLRSDPLDPSVWGNPARQVRLSIDPEAGPVLEWKGISFPLERLGEDPRLPIEMLADGDTEDGIAAFRAARDSLELGSDFELALLRLAYPALQRGEGDTAVRIFELTTELFPHSSAAWDSLGDGLFGTGDRAGAERAYLEALEYDALNSNALIQLAALREGTGPEL
jgi:tetratricopeptide (TPR) repeat protein